MLRTSTLVASTLRSLVSIVDLDATALKLLLIERANGGLRLLLAREGDETETSGAASITVAHHNRLSERRA